MGADEREWFGTSRGPSIDKGLYPRLFCDNQMYDAHFAANSVMIYMCMPRTSIFIHSTFPSVLHNEEKEDFCKEVTCE